MNALRRLRPSPAMIVALVALSIALSSSAVAVTLITGADIRDGSVTGADIRNGSLRGADIADGSVQLGDLSRAARAALRATTPAGGVAVAPRGPAGPQGPPGVPGSAGPRGAPGGERVMDVTNLNIHWEDVTTTNMAGPSLVTAACQPGERILTGGYRINPEYAERIHVTRSFPSYAHLGTPPGYWTADAWWVNFRISGEGDIENPISATATCLKP